MKADDVGDDQEITGLAGERTDLAWSRSGLAVLACLAGFVKRILPEFSTLDARAIVLVALAVGAIAWAFGLLWAREVAATTLMGRRIADPRTMRVVAVGTAALGAAAFVVALIPVG